jgi:hypothetical protein
MDFAYPKTGHAGPAAHSLLSSDDSWERHFRENFSDSDLMMALGH